MHIKELRIQHFRGFSCLVVKPKGHVVVMGEPGAGRSDLIEALGRVLDANARRTRSTTELDFYNKDTSKPIQITLTLGGLDEEMKQNFCDHLEFWDNCRNHLIPETDAPEETDEDHLEWVLRIGYWARWLSQEEPPDEWVFYPKNSIPGSDSFAHANRRDIEKLGFSMLQWSGASFLDLGSRGNFRRVINRAEGDDFTEAVEQYVREVARAAEQFSESHQVRLALESVITPLRELLRIPATNDVSQLLQFAPEGGAPSGLLRSLGPTIDVGDVTGGLPAQRRGSTTATLFRLAETLALSTKAGLIAIDDLGDGLDAASAAHLATRIRKSAGQAWVTTRVPAVAEIFEPQEVVRLGRDASGARFACQGKQPANKMESVTAKHWHRNLIPALSYRSVVVVEGPDDFTALHNLALRMYNEQGLPLPAARGVAIINAGAGGDGGYPSVLKLAGAAKQIGLRAVGAVDGDTRSDVQDHLKRYLNLSDAIVRLPDGIAIEAAIVNGIPDEVMRQVIKDVADAVGLTEPQDLAQLSDTKLTKKVNKFIKDNSLHGLFIDALPSGNLPTLAILYLEKLVAVATGTQTGLIQICNSLN